MANTGKRRTTKPAVEAEADAEVIAVEEISSDPVDKLADESEVVEPEPVEEMPKPTAKKKKAESIIPKDIDASQYVAVKNGFNGKLIYKSPHTGERFEWDSFGDEQEMELRELKYARNSAKKFFINNWFMFDEDWIVQYLGVTNYYKHALTIDHFDDIFYESADEIAETVSHLSDGQKHSVAYRAKELISEGKIDSISAIHALESALGIELIER